MTLLMPAAIPPTPAAAITLLDELLASRITPAALAWFREQCHAIAIEHQVPDLQPGQCGRQLCKALGLAARKLGKGDLSPESALLLRAIALRSGFDPSLWSVDQAARVAFILASFSGDEATFAARLDFLADSAEINELIALYAGFPLYPAAAHLLPRAREAIRSSMRPVFEAMAQRNPWPMEHFDDGAWNQMVVKTFFLDSPLWPVQGVAQRANPELAAILLDLLHERHAAGRAISAELWRCVVPFANEHNMPDLLRVLEEGSEAEKIAMALSLPVADGAAGESSKTREAAGFIRVLAERCEQGGWLARAQTTSWPELLRQ